MPPRGTLFKLLIFFVVISGCWAVVGNAVAGLTIASEGKSRYRIVIATNAIPSERYAAEELQRYLEKISGAKLPIITDAEKDDSREILLGDNAHLRKLRKQPDLSQRGTDGFILRADGDRFIIAGGKPRGTLSWCSVVHAGTGGCAAE